MKIVPEKLVKKILEDIGINFKESYLTIYKDELGAKYYKIPLYFFNEQEYSVDVFLLLTDYDDYFVSKIQVKYDSEEIKELNRYPNLLVRKALALIKTPTVRQVGYSYGQLIKDIKLTFTKEFIEEIKIYLKGL